MFGEPIDDLIDTFMTVDPAARSRTEVVLCYPGFHAIIAHRVAHKLWQDGHLTLARFVSHLARVFTGIEIHPGATIGRRFVIDHGMGVVIGETTVVGDDCCIYQGVTLGAGAEARQGELMRGKKRHPTLGNHVVVGSGAEIQGDIKIGDFVRVASGSIVMKDVPDNSIVVGVPGRVIYKDGKRIKEGDKVPDIEAEAIKSLKRKIECVEQELTRLKNRPSLENPDTSDNSSDSDADFDNSSDPIDEFLQGAGI